MGSVYEDALETVNSGLWLQLERSAIEHYNHNFIDTGIFKPTEKSQLFPDGYGRLVNVPIFKIDWDKIDYYHETDPDWIDSLEVSDYD